MGGILCNQDGKNSVLNIGNGLDANTYFWAYFTDESATTQKVTTWELFTLDTLVKNQRPNSLFGFGDPCCSDYQITSWELDDIIETTDPNAPGLKSFQNNQSHIVVLGIIINKSFNLFQNQVK